MSPKNCFAATLAVALCLPCVDHTSAAEPDVRPATYTRPVAVPLGAATFGQSLTQVGDRVSQDVHVELNLKTTILQADQLASAETTTVRRRQLRFLEVVAIDEGRMRRAHVSFPKSRLQSPENENAAEEIAQAIESKSYFVTRDGDRLLVTDAEGAIPPLEEFKLVVSSVQALGLPSPLAKFLVGRTVQLGEQLRMPDTIAREILGHDDQLGTIRSFELKLTELIIIDGQLCAVFAATIDAAGDENFPVEMKVQGVVTIQTATCRTIRAELTGPLTMSATERTAQGSFQVTADGNMRMVIESKYGHAPK